MLLAVCLALSIASAAPTSGSQVSTVSFVRDLAPLLREHCTTCHRPGGDAPFSLASFDEARRRAALLAAVTASGYMPPWKPEPGVGDFKGRRRLTAAETRVFHEWASQGAPRGEGSAAIVLDDTTAWPAGRPDLTLRLPPFRLPADGADVFRNFVVPMPVDGARIVRGLHFKPGHSAVHHANIRVDPTANSRALDEADPEAGYEGIIARTADFPDGQFLGWTPGQIGPVLDDELAWRLPAGADLVVQLHLRPTGAAEMIAPEIGVYFGNRVPVRAPVMIRLSRQDLRIPAGAAAHIVEDSFVLPVPAELRAIQPHAHTRARSVRVWADVPGQPSSELLRIADWDFRWQDRYVWRAPVPLPAGSTISMRYAFDNSAANPRHPGGAPRDVQWGWRTSDEMADVWLQVMTATAGDRRALAAAAAIKMQREDIVGSEALVARQPDHVALRNDLAMLYMSLKDPAAALRHFSAVTRIAPASASAHYNEGVAREASGDLEGARSAYQRAIERRHDYAAAHNNLGTVLIRAGDVAGALASFDRAVTHDPANAEAMINLAIALLRAGKPDESLERAAAFVELRPDRLPDIAPVVWQLAAHREPAMRRPAPARRWAEHLASAGSRAPAFLDLLAAAQAAGGDFDAAVGTISDAIAQLPRDTPAAERAAMSGRLALYRARRPFVLP